MCVHECVFCVVVDVVRIQPPSPPQPLLQAPTHMPPLSNTCTAVPPTHPLVRITLPPPPRDTPTPDHPLQNMHLECVLGMARLYCCTALHTTATTTDFHKHSSSPDVHTNKPHTASHTPQTHHPPNTAHHTHDVRCMVELAPGSLQGVPSGCALTAEVVVKHVVNLQRDAMEQVWEYVSNHAGHTRVDLQGVCWGGGWVCGCGVWGCLTV